jgi:hypothetical protein
VARSLEHCREQIATFLRTGANLPVLLFMACHLSLRYRSSQSFLPCRKR